MLGAGLPLCWTNYFASVFRLHGTARSSTAVFADLLLACYLANTACAIANIMTTLIFIILIVSRLHAFFLVVPVRSFLQARTCVLPRALLWQSRIRNKTRTPHVPDGCCLLALPVLLGCMLTQRQCCVHRFSNHDICFGHHGGLQNSKESDALCC